MSFEKHQQFMHEAKGSSQQATGMAGRIKAVREQRNSLARTYCAMVEGKSAATWTDKDQKEADRLASKIEALEREMEVLDAQFQAMDLTGSATGSPSILLAPTQRLPMASCDDRELEGLSLGKCIRGSVTGDWTNAPLERRVMAESLGSGGYTLPETVSRKVIEAARANSVCIAAGARTLPMETAIVKVARVDTPPAASWKTENGAATDGGATFGVVTFSAKVLISIMKLSVELFEDAEGVDEVLVSEMGKSMGLELDRVGLRGTGTAPEPRGILNTTNVQSIVLGSGAGAAMTNYSNFVTACRMLEAENFKPGAVIQHPRNAYLLDGFADTTGQPLIAPPSYQALNKFTTTQIPINLTVGASTDCSEVYVGDFTKLVFGIRTQIRFEVFRAAADENGSAFQNLQVWLRCYMRADVGVLQPKAFVKMTGVR